MSRAEVVACLVMLAQRVDVGFNPVLLDDAILPKLWLTLGSPVGTEKDMLPQLTGVLSNVVPKTLSRKSHGNPTSVSRKGQSRNVSAT